MLNSESNIVNKSLEIVQDVNQAISVIRNAARWLKDSGKNPSKWWQLKNLNRKFLFRYVKPNEFYVILVNKKPAAAAILQLSQNAQDWKHVDKNRPQPALYIHWLCVHRQFAGRGLPKIMVDFAAKLAKENNINLLRADTDADETKLRKIYRSDSRRTAFYQKSTI